MKILVLAIAILTSVFCYGSDQVSGKIKKIGGQLTAQAPIVYFGLDQEPANRPPCSTHPEYHYIIDVSTDEGKALYSMLLASEVMGRAVTMKGAGNCIANQPMEAVSYWYFWSS